VTGRSTARPLHRSARVFADWERGRHRPDAYYQDLLCALLGVTAYELGFRGRLPWEPESREPDDERGGAPASERPAWTLVHTVADIARFAERDLSGAVGDDSTSIVSGTQLTEAVQPQVTYGSRRAETRTWRPAKRS
jgi:hypothetical protein